MRTNKFLLSVASITCLMLLYVYQQSEIYRLGYTVHKQQEACQDLLENNTLLGYNIRKSSSVVCLGNGLFKAVDFQMPDAYQLVRVEYPQAGVKLSKVIAGKENILARLFGVKSEAQAKTLSP